MNSKKGQKCGNNVIKHKLLHLTFLSSFFLSDILCCRSDKLYAYLSQHRPDLCILEGEEDEADEEDFVLLDEEEQEEEEGSPREGQAGEDWEVSHLLNEWIDQTTHTLHFANLYTCKHNNSLFELLRLLLNHVHGPVVLLLCKTKSQKT